MIDQFLNERLIDLLAHKGIKSVDDLDKYHGEDRFILQIQLYIRRKIERINSEVHENLIPPSNIEAVNQGDNVVKDGDYLNKVMVTKKHVTNPLNIEGIKESILRLQTKTLEEIENYCEEIIYTVDHPTNKVILTEILKRVVADIIQRPFKIPDNEIITTFCRAGELAGIPHTLQYCKHLDQPIENFLKSLLMISHEFEYDELFGGLLERRISRLERKLKHHV